MKNNKTYRVIYADPPWSFKNYSKKGENRNANKHYETMSDDDICSIPVKDWCRDDTLLFLWVTGPKLEAGFRVLKEWGFKYSGVAFTWVKLKKNFEGEVRENAPMTVSDFFMSTGYGTRANMEICLLGKKKIVNRKSAKVRELLISPLREHSRKPDETYDRIEEFVGGEGPFLEMFARQSKDGWDALGNQTELFDEGTIDTRKLRKEEHKED
jgi:N6-adenosine-specific RNA methylase IME4